MSCALLWEKIRNQKGEIYILNSLISWLCPFYIILIEYCSAIDLQYIAGDRNLIQQIKSWINVAFCHKQSRRSHWAWLHHATQHESLRLWTTTHISFPAKFSFLSKLQTWIQILSCTSACWTSHQVNIHRGKVHR